MDQDQAMATQDIDAEASDADLVERARTGDRRAFGELWNRHYRPAIRAARQFTSIDADDLVSEAYTRIYQRVLAGGGPTGAFRPYLYTTIRNLAASWGSASRDVQVDEIEDFQDERIPDDPASWALDRTLTARAFRSLPDRWQTVLWYTEVEGMDPHEVAPIMGLSANGVAALSYRAREGLRRAWLQAHITDDGASPECRWTMARLGEHARHALGDRDRGKVEAHLATCSKCTIISSEVDEVGSHLAMVMIPLLLGGTAGGALLASLAQPSAAVAAEAIPELPAQIAEVAGGVTAASAPVVGGLLLGGASTTAGIAGAVALAAAVTGGIVLGVTGGLPADAGIDPGGTSAQGPTSVAPAAPAAPSDAASAPESPDASPAEDPLAIAPTAGPDPADASGPLSGLVDGSGSISLDQDGLAVDGQGQLGTISGSVSVSAGSDGIQASGDANEALTETSVSFTLSGTAEPGARLELSALNGTVYADTVVDASGHYSLAVAALPANVTQLKLVQGLTHSQLLDRLGPVGGLLNGVLGGVVQLVQNLLGELNAALTFSGQPSGVTITKATVEL